MNKLSAAVLAELSAVLDELEKNDSIRLLSLKSGKKGIFIAGADIAEIMSLGSAEEAREKSRLGQELMSRISALRFPTIAAIDGACVGGGLELALACTYRVASDDRQDVARLPRGRPRHHPGLGRHAAGAQALRPRGRAHPDHERQAGRRQEGPRACASSTRCIRRPSSRTGCGSSRTSILGGRAREQVLCASQAAKSRRALPRGHLRRQGDGVRPDPRVDREGGPRPLPGPGRRARGAAEDPARQSRAGPADRARGLRPTRRDRGLEEPDPRVLGGRGAQKGGAAFGIAAHRRRRPPCSAQA